MTEIEFAGETELCGDVFDGEALVGEKEAGLVEAGALYLLMNRSLAGTFEKSAETGVADFADGSEFAGLPIAKRIGGNGVDDADNGGRQSGVRRNEEIPRHE